MTDTMNYKTFNLAQLTKCYDHIICVHLFCLKSDERIKIQQYVCKIVGKCKSSSNCLSIQQHSTRKREEKQKKQDLHDENINNIDSFEEKKNKKNKNCMVRILII
eukprot:133166_1